MRPPLIAVIFVGAEAYTEAGGTILRDLFTEDRGGYFEYVALLDLLVTGKLGRAADALRKAEGWKWTEAHLDFPHAHRLRRTYPHPVELSAEDQAALDAAQAEFNSMTEQHERAEELPDDVDARFGELEAEIERLEAKRQAYEPDHIARGGAFVILNHDGTVRIERGFIRTEMKNPNPKPSMRAILWRAPMPIVQAAGQRRMGTGRRIRAPRTTGKRQSFVGYPCS
jgi:ParB family chromosome partitioning protein